MLKPSQMGVTGRNSTISDHKRKVIEKLELYKKQKGRHAIVAEACLALMGTPSGGFIDIGKLNSSEISDIKNYFAEVMGPIWCAEHRLIPGIKSSDKTFYSSSDTERLYDFKIIKSNEEILISNKQKVGGTNTLKPGDVISLINKDAHLRKKWRNTKYYEVFETLTQSNVVSGPIKVISECYPEMTRVTKKEYQQILLQLTRNDVILEDVPESIMQLIDDDPTTREHFKKRKKVSGTMINFLFEKILVGISANDDNYHKLFIDVTKGNVMFLKFDLNNKGKIYFNIENPMNSLKKARLRSKQGVERRSSSGVLKLDKLGFQPN